MSEDTPSIAASEGDWIEWKGGNCPVPLKTLVDVRRASGSEGRYEASVWDGWTKTGHSSDIIAYRLVRTAL